MRSDYDPTKFNIEFDPLQKRMSGYTVHGNKYFEVPFISEIAENLWVGGCETGLILPENIKHIVSLYPWERYEINHDMDSETYVKMYDSEGQGFSVVNHLANWVNECRKTAPVLLHCQAGLNRSNLIAATALKLEGYSGREAIDLIREKRSEACLCNRAFEKHLLGE